MSDPVMTIPCAGGIDQSTRTEISNAVRSFAQTTNVRQEKQGGASKRPGFAPGSVERIDASERASGQRVMMNGSQVVVLNDATLEVHAPTPNRWVEKQRLPEAAYRFLECPSIGAGTMGSGFATGMLVSDVAYVNGYIVVAITVLTGGLGTVRYAYVVVIDAANGAVVSGPESLDSSLGLEQIALGTCAETCMLVVADGDASEIRFWKLDTTDIDAGWSAGPTTQTDFTNNNFAVANVPDLDDRIVVAWGLSSGTDRVKLITATASAITHTATIDTSSVSPAIHSVDLTEHGSTVFVSWAQAADCKVAAFDPSALTVTGTAATIVTTTSTPARVFIGSTDDATALIMAYTDDVNGTCTKMANVAISAGAVVGVFFARDSFNAVPFGRPFLRGGRVYAPMASRNGDEVIVADCTLETSGQLRAYLRPVCAPIARGLTYDTLYRGRIAAISSSEYAHAFVSKKTGVSSGSTLVVIDFAARSRWQPATHNKGLWLSGGCMSLFDTVRLSEGPFLCAPPVPEVDTSVAGSVTLVTGRRYCAAYACADGNGNLHISGVSNPSDSTGAFTTQRIDVKVHPLAITARELGDDTKILLFATADGAEPPYHLIAVADNDPSASIITMHDSNDSSDESTLLAGALLYGSGNLPGTVQDGQPGGPQDHRAPPGLSFLTSYNGMLVGASGSDVWYSAQPVAGEGTWFSPIFVVPIGQVITALEVLDGSLVVFTRRSIYIVAGDPPNDAGTSGGLGSPRLLTSVVGAISGVTCVSSKGVWFQSDRGIEVLNRGLSVEWIGTQVQDEVASFPIVTAIVADTRNALVRVSLVASLDADTNLPNATGRDVVYDLMIDGWVTRDRKAGAGADAPTQDAAMIYSESEDEIPAWRYAWLSTTGILYTERDSTDDGAHLDDDAWVDQSIETHWIHVADMQGEQFIDQLLLLAQRHTDHSVTISIAYDYVETFTDTKTFTPDQISALARAWLVKEVVQTTSTAIKIRIADAAPDAELYATGNGKGATWIALTANGQPHRGAKRSSAAQRGG